MKLVSIETFISSIFEQDKKPPAASTIRRHCSQFNDDGSPKIPGACKIGKMWKIDINAYVTEMEERMTTRTDINLEDREFLKKFSTRILK